MKRLPKFPCRECKSAVKNSQDAISCDTCHHNGSIKNVCQCATRFSTAIHKMTNLSGYVQTVVSLKYPLMPSKTQVEKLMSKMTFLESDTNRNQTSSKLFAVNFQSIWNKTDELSNFLVSDNIDTLIGSETHLSYNYIQRRNSTSQLLSSTKG